MREQVLRVRVVCSDLPGRRFRDPQRQHAPLREPVYLGIQRGREVVEQAPGDSKRATFLADFRVGRQGDGSPNFLGPFAQGTPADRFFYLSWGVRKRSGQFEMFRRLKIRLGHLGWREIRQSIATRRPMTVKLRLTDRHGGPLCATPPESHIKWVGLTGAPRGRNESPR